MTHAFDELTDEQAFAIEALAHGEDDLVPEALRAELEARDDFRALLEHAKALSIDVGLAFRQTAPPEPDVEAMVQSALAAVPPAPSRRMLWLAGAVGVVGSAGLGLLSMRMPTRSELLHVGSGLVALLGALDRLVSFLPGGYTLLAAALAVGVMLLAWPARVAARRRSLAALFLAFTFGTVVPGAHAQSLEGTWPATERAVTVHVDGAPCLDVLRAGAASVGLGLVAGAQDLGTCTVHLDAGSLAALVGEVLPEGYVAERTEALLMVRRAGALATAPPTAVPASPAPAVLPERTTWGEDVLVAAGERVRAVTTAGGDATVLGEVLANVVTMGGDVHVGSHGVVRGDLVTMGGDVHLARGAQVEGRMVTMGGSVHRDGVVEAEDDADAEPTLAERAAGVGAKHLLLFVFGLVLVGGMRERHAALASAVVKEPVRAGLYGGLSLAAALIAIAVLAITIVGLPAAVLVGLGAMVGLYAGTAVVASVLGAVLPIKALQGRPIAQLAAGVAMLFGVAMLPTMLANLALLAVAAVGFGAVVMTRFGRRRIGEPAPEPVD